MRHFNRLAQCSLEPCRYFRTKSYSLEQEDKAYCLNCYSPYLIYCYYYKRFIVHKTLEGRREEILGPKGAYPHWKFLLSLTIHLHQDPKLGEALQIASGLWCSAPSFIYIPARLSPPFQLPSKENKPSTFCFPPSINACLLSYSSSKYPLKEAHYRLWPGCVPPYHRLFQQYI